MSKQKTLAATNPRYSYRTPKEEKAQVEKQIKALVERANNQANGVKYYHIDQNTVFLEAVYRGLQYLERANLTPEHDEGFFQMEFVEKDRRCQKCRVVAVLPDHSKSKYTCQECGAKFTKDEFYDVLRVSEKKDA